MRSIGARPAPRWAAAGMSSAIAVALVAPAAQPIQGTDPPRPPLGLPAIVWPASNPYSPAKAELGRLLYFEKRLSSDRTVACATCHDPAHAFSMPLPLAIGIHGQKETRNAPTDINRAFSNVLPNPAAPPIPPALAMMVGPEFWDGRANGLEEQAKGPISNPLEMTDEKTPAAALQAAVTRLKAVPGYVRRFQQVFGTADFTIDQVTMALATFERTILSGNSPYDRWKAGDQSAMNPSQLSGYQVFVKAKCDQCHLGFNFTDNNFANIGIGMNNPSPDWGRFTVTSQDTDRGAFKTPTMREVANTAPYMHDGSVATLEAVVDHYNQGGTPNPWLDNRIVPLNLTAQQKADLVAFMQALSGEGWQNLKAPTQPP